MDVMEAIEKRKSIRSYKETSIPDTKLETLLAAARLAQSGGNRQQWKFVVVKNQKLRKRLSEAANGQAQVAQAPVVIAGVALDPGATMICGVPGYAVDLAIALDHITLAAMKEGLGTCWIGAFSQDKTRKILDVPDKYTIVGLLTVGYAADEGRPKTRKTLEEIICYDTFKE
jgi:nitroreductase